jgi:hypothetical protein
MNRGWQSERKQFRVLFLPSVRQDHGFGPDSSKVSLKDRGTPIRDLGKRS